MLGETLELTCIFSGKPAPHVTWKREGGDLPVGRYVIEDYGRLLRIWDVQWEDENEFTCTGSNIQGNDSFTFNIDVQSKPQFIPDNAIPERQILQSKNITEGGTVGFYCGADPQTDPTPEVTVMINTKSMVEDRYPLPAGWTRRVVTSVHGKPDKVLTIYNTVYTDSMTIQCRISNVHGEIIKNVYLNVLPVNTGVSTGN